MIGRYLLRTAATACCCCVLFDFFFFLSADVGGEEEEISKTVTAVNYGVTFGGCFFLVR